ncbi:hypothetical protein D9756_009550 [Leucocoprinus leucothites]|uniref:Uncharacterized protein n=1 Tax=Leucocoprinus leucothites TaxID=201217 RepID=A0A8H5CUV6_9AGAR|nr:hypothetical protein D9756_009550 [Leucoagaricus leucothites]
MSDPPSLVVSYLKLPPDEELFLRIRDLFQTIMEKLDHLILVLVSAQDTQPFSEIEEALEDLQKAAGAHCLKGQDVALSCRFYGRSMLKLVDTLPASSNDDEFLSRVGAFSIRCESIIKDCDASMEGMEELSHKIPITVSRIKVALEEGDRSREHLVFTEANSQVVNDLIQTVRDCPAAFLPVKEYFQEARKHFQDKESFRVNAPSKEEINIMRQRWTTFTASMEGISRTIGLLRSKIATGPDILNAPGLLDALNAQSSGAASSPGIKTPPVTRKAILNASTADFQAVSPDATTPSRTKTSWWRRALSRLIPKFLRRPD